MAALPDRYNEEYASFKCIGILEKNKKYRYTADSGKEFPSGKVFIFYNNEYKRGRHVREVVLRPVDRRTKTLIRGISNTSTDIGRFEILCKKEGENNICTLGISIDNDDYTKLKLSPIMIWILLDYITSVENLKFYIDEDVSDGFWDTIGMIENPNVNNDSPYAGYAKVITYKSLQKYASIQKKKYYESVENNMNKFNIKLTDTYSIGYGINSRNRNRNRNRSRSPYKGGKHRTKKYHHH
jgi:hypothetical protein